MVNTLLGLGVDVDATNSGGQTPLHYAVSSSAGAIASSSSRACIARRSFLSTLDIVASVMPAASCNSAASIECAAAPPF